MEIEIKQKIERKCLNSKPLEKMTLNELKIEKQIIEYLINQKEGMEGFGALFELKGKANYHCLIKEALFA